MPGNVDYQAALGSNYRAITYEMRAKQTWTPQMVRLNPILASIKENGAICNKNSKRQGTAMVNPLLYDTVPSLSTGNYGVSDVNQFQTAWPDYLIIDGMTHARWEWTWACKAYQNTQTELTLLSNGSMGNLKEGKQKAFMVKHAKVFDDWLSGNAGSSRTNLQGLQHLMSTSNTVGGINQGLAGNSWWQANVTSFAGGIVIETTIQSMVDTIGQVSNEAGNPMSPDIMWASNTSAFNVYNKVRNFLTPQQRLVNTDFKAKYGIKSYQYMDMAVFQNNKVAGEVWIVPTDVFYWAGSDTPMIAVRDLPGGFNQEVVFGTWACLGTDMPSSLGRITGGTS